MGAGTKSSKIDSFSKQVPSQVQSDSIKLCVALIVLPYASAALWRIPREPHFSRCQNSLGVFVPPPNGPRRCSCLFGSALQMSNSPRARALFALIAQNKNWSTWLLAPAKRQVPARPNQSVMSHSRKNFYDIFLGLFKNKPNSRCELLRFF